MPLKMTKKKIIKEDGRYLIFYEFEEDKDRRSPAVERKEDEGEK